MIILVLYTYQVGEKCELIERLQPQSAGQEGIMYWQYTPYALPLVMVVAVSAMVVRMQPLACPAGHHRTQESRR